MAGDLDGERIRHRPSSALFILDPSGMREGHRNRSAVDQELDIDGVGVTRRDGNDQRLVNAVNRFPGPAIDGSEVSKHGSENYSGGDGRGANGWLLRVLESLFKPTRQWFGQECQSDEFALDLRLAPLWVIPTDALAGQFPCE